MTMGRIKRFFQSLLDYLILISCFVFVLLALPVLVILEKLMGDDYEDQK